MREDLRRYLGNTETGKCRKSLQYWAFEKKYKAKTELYEYDKSSIHLPRQEMNKSENPDESSLFGVLSPEFTTILLP